MAGILDCDTWPLGVRDTELWGPIRTCAPALHAAVKDLVINGRACQNGGPHLWLQPQEGDCGSGLVRAADWGGH